MILEKISNSNIHDLSGMMAELWPESSQEQELDNCYRILGSDREIVYLARIKENAIAFIYLSIRKEYVEGVTDYPVAYVEGIYVMDGYRRKGIGNMLLDKAREWAVSKGCSQLASDAEFHNSKSRAFHNKYGFQEANRVVNYILDLEE